MLRVLSLAALAGLAAASAAPAQGIFVPAPGRPYLSSAAYLGNPQPIGYIISTVPPVPTSQINIFYYAPAPVIVMPPPVVPGAARRDSLDDLLPRLRQPDGRALPPPPQPPIVARREPAPLPGPPPAAPDAKLEHAQEIALGKEFFAAGLYARAERHFGQAVAALPDEPTAHFLLAQARFAQGKYREAVESIHEGLRLEPQFPQTAFRVRDLYAANAPAFVDQVRRLTEARDRFADDAVLLFLSGYELWFDDRRGEAQPLFARARAVGADPVDCGRFAPPAVLPPLFLLW